MRGYVLVLMKWLGTLILDACERTLIDDNAMNGSTDRTNGTRDLIGANLDLDQVSLTTSPSNNIRNNDNVVELAIMRTTPTDGLEVVDYMVLSKVTKSKLTQFLLHKRGYSLLTV